MASQIKLTLLKKPRKSEGIHEDAKKLFQNFSSGPSASVVFFNGNAAELGHSDSASIERKRQQPWCGSLPLPHPSR